MSTQPTRRECPFCGEPQAANERFCSKCGNEYPFDDPEGDVELEEEGHPARARAGLPWYRTLPFLLAVVVGIVVVGYGLFRFGVSFLESRRPEPEGGAVLTASPARTTGPGAGAASPSPVLIQPSPSPGLGRVRVANTEGQGANLRQRPSTSAPLVRSLADSTILEVIGSDQQAEGRTWRNVREPAGATGWLAAEFLAPE